MLFFPFGVSSKTDIWEKPPKERKTVWKGKTYKNRKSRDNEENNIYVKRWYFFYKMWKNALKGTKEEKWKLKIWQLKF